MGEVLGIGSCNLVGGLGWGIEIGDWGLVLGLGIGIGDWD